MKIIIYMLVLVTITGCRSIWHGDIPESEIMYQGAEIRNSSGHMLGFVQPDGKDNQVLEIKRQFDKAVWSADGNFLYGLSDATGSYMGYPAYWDLQKGQFGLCKRDLPYFEQIQGLGNPDNPYEVIVQDAWTILKIDLSTCKKVHTFVDYSDRPDKFAIAGFSFSPTRQELVYGRITEPYKNRGYEILQVDVKTGKTIRIAEGINPTWSPEGEYIAFIGLDGLYVLTFDRGGPISSLLVDQPFFNPWVGPSPWTDISIPYWSPDGNWIIYHRCDTTRICHWEDARIYKISTYSGEEETILVGGEFPNWRP